MLFGYITLAVAFFLSVVAAYYSVLGLVAIFSAAVIPVMIMGGALETGKVVAAMWLHRNWHRAPWTYKAYLLPSLLALMLLTSMGTFGYLSKAHSDQSLVSGDVQSKIAIYDEKIRISRENIDANRRALKQLDAAVDQIMGRSTTEQGAERSVQIRRQQAPERQRLIRDIEAEQKKISELNEARAPIAAEVRKVEAEVGPIKYIAALIYGDNPENNLLESAVRWVIILIVVVFDPLAIVLILAGSKHLEWERTASRTRVESIPVEDTPTIPTPEPEPEVVKQPVEPSYLKPGTWFNWKPFDPRPMPAYLTRPWIDRVPGIDRIGPLVFRPEPKVDVVETTTTTTTTLPKPPEPQEPVVETIQEPIIANTGNLKLKDDYVTVDEKSYSVSAFIGLYPERKSEIDQLRQQAALKENNQPATFGASFPKNPAKGHLHVNTNVLPSKLYRFNGFKWVEVDKNLAAAYTNNREYLNYLISKLEDKSMTMIDLTDYERSMVEDYIKQNPQ
jgi:hypothetical protein